MQPQPLELPASVKGRACFQQFIGALAVDRTFFDQALAQIRSIGMPAIWEANEKHPPGLYNPNVFAIAAALVTQGVPVISPKAEQDSKYVDESGVPAYAIADGTAIIPVNGPLSKQTSSLNSLFGGSNTVGMRKALALAMQDSRVARVMFHIDSPGGTVAGTGDLGDDIFEASSKKPIAAYIEDMGTSAAYWIASQTGLIFASPYANVGSIGVLWTVYDTSEAYKDAGIKVHAITSSPGKAFYVDGLPISEKQMAKMQNHVDSIYAHFISAVARGRGVSAKEARAMSGDADVYDAKTSLQKGLVDAISPFREALAAFAADGKLRLANAESRIVRTLPDGNPAADAAPTREAVADAGGSGSNTGTGIVPPEESPVTPDPPTPAGQPATAAPKVYTPEQIAAIEAKADQAIQNFKTMQEEQARSAAAHLAAERERICAEHPTVSKEAAAACSTIDSLRAIESVARAGSNKRTGADPSKPEQSSSAEDYSKVPDAWADAPGVKA